MKNNKNRLKLKYFNTAQEFREFCIKVYQFIKNQYAIFENKESHSFSHIIRVTNTSLKLALKLDAYVDLVVIAALFHDIGRNIEEVTGECHAEISARIAENFLKKHSKENMVKEVREIIRSHRYSKGIDPSTKEGKILSDADALDALGSIGLYRTISFGVEKGYSLEKAIQHFHDKLFKLPNLMKFAVTRNMADEKCKILKQFVQEINVNLKKSKFENLIDKIVK